MICGIVGKLGRGKTLLLTVIAVLNSRLGSFHVRKFLFDEIVQMNDSKKIYANYFLKIPFNPLLDKEELDSMNEGSAFLDEFWLWADSRMSMSKKNESINQMALSSRKRGLDIYYTTQAWGKVDKRVRQITDIILIPYYDIYSGLMTVEICEADDTQKLVKKEFSFNAKPFHNFYDTKQEIKKLDTVIDEIDNKKSKKIITKVQPLDYEAIFTGIED